MRFLLTVISSLLIFINNSLKQILNYFSLVVIVLKHKTPQHQYDHINMIMDATSTFVDLKCYKFYPRDVVSAVFAMATCPSARPSVRHSRYCV